MAQEVFTFPAAAESDCNVPSVTFSDVLLLGKNSDEKTDLRIASE